MEPPRLTRLQKGGGGGAPYIGCSADSVESRQGLGLASCFFRRDDLFEYFLKLIRRVLNSKLPSGLYEPLGLFLVTCRRLWLSLRLCACFCHTASQ
jgi:hypothetical protein